MNTRLEYNKERIRELVSIQQVVERYSGAKIEGNKCKCPLHKEKTGSFTIDNKKGLYYCFGCGKGGDQFSFLQTYLGIDFKSAVAQIDKDFALGVTEERISVKAQIAAREARKKRDLEELELKNKQALHDELCAKYKLYNNLLKVLEPMTEMWGQALTRRCYLEYELDKILEGL